MADEQPGGDATAAEPPDPSTVHAPVRWSGSAAVPAPIARKSRWSRHRPALDDDEPGTDDWAISPPVDPWEGQDTPWDPMPLPPPEPMPPTRIDPPAAAPAARTDPPAGTPPAWIDPAGGAAPAAWLEPPVAPAPAPSPQKRRWRRKAKPAPAPQPVNRLPVAARPAVPFPPPPPQYQRRAIPAPPAPGWRPSAPQNQRPLPPPPRRRRRWPRNLAVFTLLSAICCCGVPALLLLPAAGQYPVTAVLPDSVSDLDLRDDAASRRAAQRLSQELSSPTAFAGIYADGNGKRVTIFGITGLRLTPQQDVEAQIQHLSADYDIRDVRPFDVGEAGVHERCGIGRAAGKSVVVCAWADHGSLVTVLLTRRSLSDSAELTGVLRSAVLIRE